MPTKIAAPTKIESAGNMPKQIEEFIGKVNLDTDSISIARMKSPAGWQEPGQQPEFDEYTLVLEGMLRVITTSETMDVHADEAIIVRAGEWVQYSTPANDGATYIAICLPAFTSETVHRDDI